MTADARKLADLLESNGLDRAAMRLGANYPEALALILAALRAYEPCATCNGDPKVCATVPGLRHCEAANREHPYVEGDPINAAKIIAWSRMVRNASPGRKWTDTEIRMADAIARIAGGE